MCDVGYFIPEKPTVINSRATALKVKSTTSPWHGVLYKTIDLAPCLMDSSKVAGFVRCGVRGTDSALGFTLARIRPRIGDCFPAICEQGPSYYRTCYWVSADVEGSCVWNGCHIDAINHYAETLKLMVDINAQRALYQPRFVPSIFFKPKVKQNIKHYLVKIVQEI